MGIYEDAVGQLSVGPKFSRIQPRQHVWGIIAQLGCVAEGLRPNTTLIVLWPMQGRVDHHCASSTESGLETDFCNRIMMVASNSAVCDTLTLQEKFIHKLLGGVYAIVSTVLFNGDAYICSFSLNWSLGWTVSVPVRPT